MIKVRLKYFLLLSSIVLLLSCQKSPDEYYESANKLVNENNIESLTKAVDLLDEVILINPEFAKAYFLRAKAKLNIYLPMKVITANRKPSLIESNNTNITIDEIITDFNKALENDESLKKEVLIGKGDALLASEKYELAFSEFEKVLELEPKNKNVANSALICKFFIKDTLGGKVLLDKLIVQNPNDAENYYNREVKRLVEFNDNDGACDDLNKALELFKENEKYLHNDLKSEIEKLIEINCKK